MWCRLGRTPMEHRFGGFSRRSLARVFGGLAKCWSRMARPGRSKGSSWAERLIKEVTERGRNEVSRHFVGTRREGDQFGGQRRKGERAKRKRFEGTSSPSGEE